MLRYSAIGISLKGKKRNDGLHKHESIEVEKSKYEKLI